MRIKKETKSGLELAAMMMAQGNGRETGPATSGMVRIEDGTISGTNPPAEGESYYEFYPATYNITVDNFLMDKYLVTKGLWDDVRNDPATAQHGYTDLTVGGGKGVDHPVRSVSWFDVVKWCNARSEKEGRPAVYTVDGAVYRTGRSDNVVQSAAAGYRLPTMDEWEYAARGGLESKRFPWGHRIDHKRANYRAISSRFEYDDGPDGWVYHPKGLETGSMPYTTPVGYFPSNGYGLHDMAGNLWQWNYDWHPSHVGFGRVVRGGSWYSYASSCRVAVRNYDYPGSAYDYTGFRSVLPPGQ